MSTVEVTPRRRRRSLAVMVVVSGALGACGSPQAEPRGTTIPLDEIERPPAPAPEPESSGPLTLVAALSYAEAHAPALRVERRRVELAEAEIEATSPLLPDNPELSATAGGRIVGGGQELELAVGLEQRFEIAGERGLRRRAAERGLDTAQAQLELARWRLLQEVRCAFEAVLVGRERLEAAEGFVEFAQSLLEIAQRQVDAGDVSPLTMLVARAELAQAQQQRVDARQQLESSRLRLIETIGWPLETPLEVEGEPCSPLRAPPLEELLERARQRSPVLRMRERALTAADAQVRAADREAAPEPSLGVTYAREGDPSDPPHLWLVTLGLPLPLWQRNQGERARWRAQRELSAADLDQWNAALEARLRRAAGEVDAAAERVELFGEDIVPSLMQNLELIRRAYDLGEMDIHQVSQTRQRVMESEREALRALEDYIRAAAELQLLVGAEVWSREAR